jgi:ketosteroid isomerase-like protein
MFHRDPIVGRRMHHYSDASHENSRLRNLRLLRPRENPFLNSGGTMALRKAFSLMLIGLVMAACAPQAEEPQEVPQIDLAAEEQAVRDVNVRWLAMVNEKNTTGIAALFMADGRVLSTTTEPAVGQAAIQASMDEENAANPSRVSDWSADRVLVAGSGDLAVEFGSYSSTGGGADGTVEDWGNYVTVLRKVGGEWKIDTDSAYSTKPASTNEASSQ